LPVNTSPAKAGGFGLRLKAGGFGLRLKAGSIGLSAD